MVFVIPLYPEPDTVQAVVESMASAAEVRS